MFERTNSTILLIEDSPLDADLIKRALQKVETGVTLNIARDGEEAIAYIQRWDNGLPVPDVVLLDIQLPKINGFDVLKELKSHPRYRLLPVVMLTSSDNLDDVQTAYELGANSYVLKSNNYDQLSSAVNLIHRYWCELNVHPE